MHKKILIIGTSLLMSLSMLYHSQAETIQNFEPEICAEVSEKEGQLEELPQDQIDGVLDVQETDQLNEQSAEIITEGEESDLAQEKAIASGNFENGLKWKISNAGKLTIEKDTNYVGEDESASYVIPDYEKVKNTPWYASREKIVKIEMKEGVSRIGSRAFAQLVNVTELTIPQGVNSIGFGAIKECVNLKKITLYEGLTTIDSEAFKGCQSLSQIVTDGAILGQDETENSIPLSVTYIGENAFFDCHELKAIQLPRGFRFKKNTTTLPNAGFGSYMEGDKICQMEDFVLYTYSYYSSNQDGVTPMDYVSKQGVKYQKIPVSGPMGETARWELKEDGTLVITGVGIVEPCSDDMRSWKDRGIDIKHMKICSGITEIGKNTFAFMYDVEDIVFPDGLEIVGDCAFTSCLTLKEIILPKSVTSIDADAFSSCLRLEHIELPEGLEKIPYSMASNCWSLKEVEIPKSVKKIASFAFSGCEKLKNVSLPEGLTTLEIGCFDSCSALQEIRIPESVTEIQDNVFRRCTSLKSVTLPKNLSRLNSGCFDGCSALQEIVIPESVTVIRNKAIVGCSSLKSVCILNADMYFMDGCMGGYFENKTFIPYPDFTLIGKVGSTAKEYAEKYGFQFVEMHEWDDGEILLKPTCEVSGKVLYHCKTCDSVMEKELEATGHSYASDYTVDIQATCEAQGEKSRHCMNTGCIGITDKAAIAALGHDMQPNADETKLICLRCGMEQEVDVKQDVELNLKDGAVFKDKSSELIYKIISVKNKKVSVVGVNNKNKKKIIIPKKVKLGGISFTVTEIRSKAFRKNKKITSVLIPSSVTKIGSRAFEGCKKLKNIQIKTKKLTTKKVGKNAFKGIYTKAKVQVPKSKKKTYQAILKKKGLTNKTKIRSI